MVKKSAPLSQTQWGIYLDCLSMKEAGAYNGHFLLTLDADIDLNLLAGAIENAVAAHPSIFVRIVEKDGEPVQQYVAEDYRQRVEQMKKLSADLTLRLCPFLTATTKNFPLTRSRKLFRLITQRLGVSARQIKFLLQV